MYINSEILFITYGRHYKKRDTYISIGYYERQIKISFAQNFIHKIKDILAEIYRN